MNISVSSISLNHPLNESRTNDNERSVININITNRERKRYHRIREKRNRYYNKKESPLNNPFRTRRRIGGHNLLKASRSLPVRLLMDIRRQREARLKQRECYIGCDRAGFVNFVENSILRSQYKYSMMSKLGGGTFSRVFRCQKMDDKKQYAIKLTRRVKKYQLAAMNELTILKHIAANDVDNLSCCIHIIDCGVYYEHPMFVFPLLSKSLRSWMNKPHKPFDIDQIMHFVWQMCRAIDFIHSLGIINTDLKPDNIMLVSDEMDSSANLKSTQIKIIDFGSAVFHKEDRKYHHVIQTREYRAPEVILGSSWSFEVDTWSLGCILVELIHDALLFPKQSGINHLHQIVECIGPPPSYLLPTIHDKAGDINRVNLNYRKLNTYFVSRDESSDNEQLQCAELFDLCTKMLCWNSMDRINAKAALHHPLFKGGEFTYYI